MWSKAFVVISRHGITPGWMVVVQSILRQANFKGAKLLGASFFDSDLTGIYIYSFLNNIRLALVHIGFKEIVVIRKICAVVAKYNCYREELSQLTSCLLCNRGGPL